MAWRERLEAFNKRFTIRHRLIAAGVLFVCWIVSLAMFEAAGAPYLLIGAMSMLLNILPMMPAKKRSRR